MHGWENLRGIAVCYLQINSRCQIQYQKIYDVRMEETLELDESAAERNPSIHAVMAQSYRKITTQETRNNCSL